MRLGGRLAAAIDILDDMEARHRPAAEALKDWGVSHRYAGSGDRSAIGNIVYDALRLKASSSFRFGSASGRALAYGALVSGFGMTADEINAALEGDKFAPEPLTTEERAQWDAHDPATAPDHVRAEVPEWCAPHLAAALGDSWIEEGRELAARPPLDLRVNTLKSTDDKVLRELVPLRAEAVDGVAAAVRIPAIEGTGRHPNVVAEPAFQKGWFEVQDLGSQMVAAVALQGAATGQVLDLCAGGGGKTLAMAALLANKGQIHAYDSDKTRLAPIFDRLKRAGTRNVQVHAARSDLSEIEGRMDIVLVDAPCTGTGTWRRRPDTKWRLTEASLGLRLIEQATVLEAASAHVKPGGRLAYITCSLLPPENTGQVASFLESHPEYSAEDTPALALAAFPAFDGRITADGQGGLLLSPAKTGTDGFFLAILTKSR